jgi:ribosomal protein S19E (S16A)
MGIYDTDPQTYNIKLAEALKKGGKFPMPDWARYVKTGNNQSRLPDNQE